MKKLISLLLCILALSGCAATYDGPTESERVLTEYTVRHISLLTDDFETTRSVYAYDIYGNRVRIMKYDAEGELAYVENMRYDDRGNEVSRISWDHSGWIPYIDRRVKQTYDDQNRITNRTTYNMWGLKLGESIYTYDDEAHTMTWENGAGDWVIYYYDENGRQLRDVSEGAAGTIETVYSYDQRGNRIGWVSTMNGQPQSRYEARYDDQDRQIWGGYYDETGKLTYETTYTYDRNTRTITKPGGGTRVEYYNEDGTLSSIMDFDEDGELYMDQSYYYRDIRVPADGEE